MVDRYLRVVDGINDVAGRIGPWLFLPLCGFVFYDVLMRYAFNAPTIWAWDINIQIAGLIAVVGAGYSYMGGGHIRIDVIVNRLPPRTRAWIKVAHFPLFMVAVGVLTFQAGREAVISVQINEAYSSFFGPPFYPFKVLFAIGCFLLFLQGIAEFVRELRVATGKEPPRHHEESGVA